MKKQLLILVLLCSTIMFAQTTITGSIYDIYLEPLSSVKISSEKGSTTTDGDGNFTLSVKLTFPFTITISGVGYKSQQIEISDFEEISAVLEKQSKLNEIVVSASRTPERIIESPVSIERIGLLDVKNTSSLNFYEGLANLKGIDVLDNSYGIKNIVSNRGFANTENTRFVQVVDGAETTLPLFNYSLGNSLGANELDVASVEVLPGAASALYGHNALNGILLTNTKSPFEYQGISAYIKGGYTNQDIRGNDEFYDVGIRMAHAFSDKFAGKVNFSYKTGEEWHAKDERSIRVNGTVAERVDKSDPSYNGVTFMEMKYPLILLM